MSGDVTFDHDIITGAMSSAKGNLDGTKVTPGATGANVDPSVTGKLDDGNNDTNDTIGDAGDDADKTKDATDGLDDADSEAAGNTKDIDTEGAGTHTSGDHGGGDPAKGGGGSPSGGGGSPLGAGDASNPSSQGGGGSPSGGGGSPQMSPMSGGSPSGGGMPMSSMPSGPQNQMQAATSPDRDKIADENMKNATAGGDVGELSDDPDGRKAQQLADKLVNHQPPIPYAWGGGHGATPGPSQGTRDGGFADRCGDYRKTGVDCSGLSRWMTHELYGKDPGGTSQSQYASGRPVDAAHAKPGDMFFPSSAGRPPHHVQVYIGNNKVIEAQQSGTFLKISPLSGGEFRRFSG